MGFVSKGKEKSLLKKKQRGTFLLRFSESVIGGITFSWMDTTSTGERLLFHYNAAKYFGVIQYKQAASFIIFTHISSMGDHTLSIPGEPEVKTVQPFTKVDLCQIPFHEIIRNFQILEAENVPENPLLYLYPNTSKDEAFGKYYTDKTGCECSISLFLIFFTCHFKNSTKNHNSHIQL